MINGYYEEGDRCQEKDCIGTMQYIREHSCSCHINPPCSACVDAPLTCNKCGFKPDEPPSKDVIVSPYTPDTGYIVMKEYKPKPWDRTKIDYRIKLHTVSSQICYGVYPDGKTMKDVEEFVKGTFGGRFTKFSNGEFEYIAYTD